MREYPKISTVFARDPATKFKTVLYGQWATPELAYLASLPWQGSEKIDGMNIRVLWDGERVTFGGRTDRAALPATLVTRLSALFYPGAFVTIFGDVPRQVCLYGEGYGKGIQHGGHYLTETVDFRCFDIWVNGIWLKQEDVGEIAHRFECEMPPVLFGLHSLLDLCDAVREGFVSRFAEDQTYLAEGLVMRPCIDLLDRRGQRIITKLKYKDCQ